MRSDGVGLPFITALPEHINAGHWYECDSEGEMFKRVKDVFEGFDPASSSCFSREIDIAHSDLRAHCRLDSRDELLLTVVIWSKQAKKRYLACDPVRLTSDMPDSISLRLDARIDGNLIAGAFDLLTDIVIDGPIHSDDIFSASLPGNVLWSDACSIEVEGGAAQFPISSGSFSDMPWIGADAAPWHLEYDQNAEAELPFASVVRLYINTDNKSMRKYHSRPEITQMIKYDVARCLLGAYLCRKDIREFDPKSDPRSLGCVIILMAKMLFPGWTMSELLNLMQTQPGRFESRIRAQSGLLHD